MKKISKAVLISLMTLLASGAFAQAKPVELEYLGARPTQTPADADNFIIKALNDKLGMSLKWVEANDNYTSKLALRIASGNPPDLFDSQSRAEVARWINEDAVLDLTPYLSRLPNWRKHVGDDAAIETSKFNGKVYALIKPSSVNYDGIFIREDWLKKLGLKVPTTIDEALAVAKAFTTMDPDGNGKNDTVGLSGLGQAAFAFIYGGYGTMGANFNTSTNLNMQVENGKPVFDVYNPRYKLALTEIKKWIDAGVVDSEVFTHKSSDYYSKVYQGKVGMIQGRWPEMRKTENEKVINSVNPNARWILIQPPKGPYGSFDGGFAKGSSFMLLLSSSLAKPANKAKLDKALALLEYLASEEGLRLVMFGQEGTHYKVEAGKVVALPAMNELTWTYAIQLLGRKDSMYLPVKFPFAINDINACIAYPFLKAYDKQVGNFPETINKADIDRFMGDSIVKFVYGGRPLTEFDAFVKELETKFGYKDYVSFVTKELKL